MGKRIRRKKAKWSRRLLPQVGMIIAAIFFFFFVASTVIQIKGSTSTYLEAKQEMLRPIAERILGQMERIPRLDYFVDRWENVPELARIWIESNETDPFYKEMIQDFPIDTDSELPTFDPDKLESYSKRQQNLLTAFMYDDVFTQFLLSVYQQDNVSAMLIDVTEEHWGTEIAMSVDYASMITAEDIDELIRVDEDFSALLDSLSGTKKVISQGISVFERYESPKEGKYYYMYITPLRIEDEIRAVLVISYDWSEHHSTLIKKQLLIAGITALVLVGAATLLLYFITRSAIRPLGRIQQGVRSYMQNKDSAEVTERMGNIKQQNEFGVLADDVSQLAEEIDRYTDEITHLTGERERVAAELSLAANIQLGVLPVEFPDVPDYQLYATMTPAKEVGGDLYDFFDIDDTHLGLVIGDVSGKGVPASLFMMIAKLMIREYAMAGGNPAEVLGKANKTLCENNKNDMFVTAWFGILDRTTGKIVAASAGHEFPILRDPDGEYTLIKDRHGFVLGGMDISKYRDYELELKPGGTILVYTDGTAEATNAEKELFGTDRMLESLNRHLTDTPKDLVEHLKEDIDAFVGDAPQFDDLTALCVRWNGSMESLKNRKF